MKIMIQWVTQSHSAMGFNLRPFENTFWNLMAALKCACIFWSIMVMVYHHAPVMARVFGRTVSVCGSICKIDLCLDIFGPYNNWENLFCQNNCPIPPNPRFQIFSQFPDSRFFGLQFPDSRFFGPLFPDSRCWFTPPLQYNAINFFTSSYFLQHI